MLVSQLNERRADGIARTPTLALALLLRFKEKHLEGLRARVHQRVRRKRRRRHWCRDACTWCDRDSHSGRLVTSGVDGDLVAFDNLRGERSITALKGYREFEGFACFALIESVQEN